MRERQHTAFAMQALDLAEMYRIMLGDVRVRGQVEFYSDISTPDGPSTGGGVQSLQHIKLIPTVGAGTLVVGHASRADMTAQLRTFDHVAIEYRNRFKTEVPFGRTEYENFINQVWQFLQAQMMSVTAEVYTPPPMGEPTPAPQPVDEPSSHLILIVVLVVAIAAIVTVAISST